MSFSDDARRAGATPITVVELDLERCSLTYGDSPCTAAVGVTGTRKCFNTAKTCQDRANFDPEDVTYRFIQPRSDIPPSFNAFALLADVSLSPTELDLSGGMGVRGQVEVSMLDAPHHDIGLDPYLADRSYDAYDRGTFWGKFLARNPFYQGRLMRVRYGFMVDSRELTDDAGNNVLTDDAGAYTLIDRDRLDLDSMETLSYVIERIAGPSAGGTVNIIGKDPLKLADDSRAVCPLPSGGELTAALSDTATSFSVSDGDDYPSGATIFKVSVGPEVMRVKRSGTTITVVDGAGSESADGRGIDSTEPESHQQNATVQLVKEFTSETLPDILEELLQDFAGVPSTFIPKAEWDDEQADVGFVFTTQISKPTGVQQLINELLKSSGAFLFYDERAQLIRLRALKPTPGISSLPLLDDAATFIRDSIAVQRLDDKRLSQVWVARGLRDSTQDITNNLGNYEVITVRIDADAQSVDEYGQMRRQVIWGRWITAAGAAAAQTIADRVLARFRDTPREISFSADPKDWPYWVGSIVAASHRNLQDDTGDAAAVPFQITRARYNGRGRMDFVAVEYRVPPSDAPTLVIDTNTQDYDVRAQYEAQIGAVGTSPIFITVHVESGVEVTSTAGNPAMTGGGFPSGSVVTLLNEGEIHGLGGVGGDGGDCHYPTAPTDGEDGADGTDAIYMTEDWEIENLGEIFGGGGGGGGGAGTQYLDGGVSAGGSGGGGGQGNATAAGGAAGAASGSTGNQAGNPGGSGDDTGPGSGGAGGAGDNSAEGGDGAAWGEDGDPGEDFGGGASPVFAHGTGGAGGAGGFAVRRNGFDATFIAGGPGDPAAIKGQVA